MASLQQNIMDVINMSKAIIEKHVRASIAGRVAPPQLLDWKTESTITSNPDYLSYRIDMSVGATVTGTHEDAEDMKKEIINSITHELYGPILQEIHALRYLCYKQMHIRTNNPIMDQLDKIMKMITP